MFPAGAPGVGLLLVRFCATGITVGYIITSNQKGSSGLLLAHLAVTTLLLVGFMTPVACLGSLIGQGIWAMEFGLPNPQCCLVGALLALAVLMIGPGAYSVDAVRFGRRRINVPRRDTD